MGPSSTHHHKGKFGGLLSKMVKIWARELPRMSYVFLHILPELSVSQGAIEDVEGPLVG